MAVEDVMADQNSGFHEYKNLILVSLDRQDKALEEIKAAVADLREDIVLLKFKSGLWGSLAGAGVSIVIAIVVAAVTKALK